MKGPPHQEPPPKVQRLMDIERVCRVILAGALDTKAFSDTGGNPNSKNVRSMFASIAEDNIFTKIKPKFDAKWGKPSAQTFVEDKLDEIVNRRHVVAHSADALTISRTDLRESIRFLRILARLLDIELDAHVKVLIKLCS